MTAPEPTAEGLATWREVARRTLRQGADLRIGYAENAQRILRLLDTLAAERERREQAEAERDYHHARADVLLAKASGGVALRGRKPGDYWAEWHQTHCAAARGAAEERARAETAEAAVARCAELAEGWSAVLAECREADPGRWILDRSVTTLDTCLRELDAALTGATQ